MRASISVTSLGSKAMSLTGSIFQSLGIGTFVNEVSEDLASAIGSNGAIQRIDLRTRDRGLQGPRKSCSCR
jgi:hypothetical protein